MPTETGRPKTPPGNGWRNLAVLFLAVLAGAGFTYWYGAYETYHLETVQPNVLYRDGNQDMREFETAMRRCKAKTIVSLIDERELVDPEKPQFKKEVEFANKANIKLAPVPVKLGGWPTTGDVRTFLDTVADPSNQPVLVHCAQGVRRTGMMVAAYQMSVLGYDKAKATAAIEKFGHSNRTVGDIKRFIEIYDPATRTVTQELKQSVE